MSHSVSTSSSTSASASGARDKLQGYWSTLKKDKSIRDLTDAAQPTFEKVMTSLFGSCTAIVPDDAASDEEERTTPPKTKQKKSFMGSDGINNRAAQVVQSLRSNTQRTIAKINTPTNHSKSQNLDAYRKKPFPVSSPRRNTNYGRVNSGTLPAVIPEVKSLANPDGGHGLSFDDGISAISAFTLDEMDRQDEMKVKYHKQPSSALDFDRNRSLESFNNIMENGTESSLNNTTGLKKIAEHEGDTHQSSNPTPFFRGRSNGTNQTKGTQSSRSTKEFESSWQKDEQNYWTNVVEEETDQVLPAGQIRNAEWVKKHELRNRSRSRSSELQRNVTVSTASSSVHSGLESPFSQKHPHETLQFEASDFFPTSEMVQANKIVQDNIISATGFDPDRIVTDEALVIHQNAEIGEI